MRSWKLAAVLAVGCFLLGCSSQEGRTGSDAENAPAGPEAVRLTGVAKGEQIYYANCAVCHDPVSEEVRIAPSLEGYFQQPPHKHADGQEREHSEAFAREFIMKGNTNMPPMNKALSPQDLENVLAYLRTL